MIYTVFKRLNCKDQYESCPRNLHALIKDQIAIFPNKALQICTSIENKQIITTISSIFKASELDDQLGIPKVCFCFGSEDYKIQSSSFILHLDVPA